MKSVPTDADRAQLSDYIFDTSRRETECCNYLKFAIPMLVDPMFNNPEIILSRTEQQGSTGRSDFIVLCDMPIGSETRRQMWVWEAKAPQLAMFKVQTNERLTPSPDLVEAENQLINYFDEYQGNSYITEKYGIKHKDDIKLGGIIISRDDNQVKEDKDVSLADVEKKSLAGIALRIRTTHFYHQNIRVITWNHILRAVTMAAPKFEQ